MAVGCAARDLDGEIVDRGGARRRRMTVGEKEMTDVVILHQPDLSGGCSRRGPLVTEAQTCTSQLGNINVCAPFVLPGAANTNPSPECCTALQAVDHDCLCSTIRIASRLPSQCHLPPLSSCNGS
ncbi:hypothetical protein RHMOL_Rhmol03G0206600 [Rhododendron molle]|uniref:Uncharacterized protein n=1 Tax=Rhododendron molle TaxID=49168 RepID=A0ACC0PGC7_RHOML|nr:hypothetical protein RHMOL_Rhmol03G0206600 [Rhododendron molle]